MLLETWKLLPLQYSLMRWQQEQNVSHDDQSTSPQLICTWQTIWLKYFCSSILHLLNYRFKWNFHQLFLTWPGPVNHFNKNFKSKKYQTKNDSSLNQSKCSFHPFSDCMKATFWTVFYDSGLWTPNEGISQRNQKIWANVTDKICFGCMYLKLGVGIYFWPCSGIDFLTSRT